ncbi:MAG: 1-deoxy-D-xylulose-5-phosphate reductoisomerase [Candidatus Omnitrophica bacterium]|nr:1-deoxy-D-xylulose-5-phosphate reductoisomerase [Candidatus Omnitrophota bacterium]
MKKIVILGSTGSIGINTLKVISRYPKKFKVVGLTAFNNDVLLEKQIKQFLPRYVAVRPNAVKGLKNRLGLKKVKVLNAEEDLSSIVSLKEVDVVVIGMTGSAALEPFLKAVQCGKTIAPANKEALVIAGEIIMSQARKYKAKIIPVDSEQSAIFQCLEGQRRSDLRKIYLTASGGALDKVPKARFGKITVEQILAHPRWKMGKKITVDSATLMNKGFEIIEAQRLFDLKIADIEVVIHPEAIIHSMVSFQDGSIMAQLGITDMRIPIQYALTYPERLDTGLKDVDFFKLKQLTFKKPDFKKFPSLGLAIHVAGEGGTLPAVLNAADEEAVSAFLKGKMSFVNIHRIVEKTVLQHKNKRNPGLKEILAADTAARVKAQEIILKKL